MHRIDVGPRPCVTATGTISSLNAPACVAAIGALVALQANASSCVLGQLVLLGHHLRAHELAELDVRDSAPRIVGLM